MSRVLLGEGQGDPDDRKTQTEATRKMMTGLTHGEGTDTGNNSPTFFWQSIKLADPQFVTGLC